MRPRRTGGRLVVDPAVRLEDGDLVVGRDPPPHRARERYDWSNPDEIRWTVVESNFCAPGSYVSAAIRPASDGSGTFVHVVWNRKGTTLQGRFAAVLIRLTRGAPVRASFQAAMKRLGAEGSPQAA